MRDDQGAQASDILILGCATNLRVRILKRLSFLTTIFGTDLALERARLPK